MVPWLYRNVRKDYEVSEDQREARVVNNILFIRMDIQVFCALKKLCPGGDMGIYVYV